MTQKQDLVDTVKADSKFRVFTQALEAADLIQGLKESGPYTIFAPTDDAFTRMRKETLEFLFEPQNKLSLQELLRLHIVPRKISSSELRNLDEVRGINGSQLRIESRAGLWINEAQIEAPDLEAANGVIHGIDAVLSLPSRAASQL